MGDKECVFFLLCSVCCQYTVKVCLWNLSWTNKPYCWHTPYAVRARLVSIHKFILSERTTVHFQFGCHKVQVVHPTTQKLLTGNWEIDIISSLPKKVLKKCGFFVRLQEREKNYIVSLWSVRIHWME